VKAACHLLSRWFLAKLVFSTLKMEAIYSSETSVDTQQTTQRYIPEDGTLHNHRCENLKPYTPWIGLQNYFIFSLVHNFGFFSKIVMMMMGILLYLRTVVFNLGYAKTS
jgi:hypothetical protein